jgi:F-type H+-transporting ATPase subunit a
MMLQGTPDIGEMVLHHTADAYSFGIEPWFVVSWHRWADIHLGPLTVNLTPTKHVVLLFLVAILVFLSMWWAGRGLERQRAHQTAPKGYANAMEAFVLFVRDEIAIVNIGHEGPRYAPFVMTLFFFILYANLLGLVPHLGTATGNVAVTGALALCSLMVIEVGGFMKLGPKGYLRTIFPKVPGMSGAGAVAISLVMAPIEVISKLVKPFALCVRLFGNMTAGHFAILSLLGLIFIFGNLHGWNWGIGVLTAVTVVGISLLEIFVALLQAYVFALLTAVFIGLMQHEH